MTHTQSKTCIIKNRLKMAPFTEAGLRKNKKSEVALTLWAVWGGLLFLEAVLCCYDAYTEQDVYN